MPRPKSPDPKIAFTLRIPTSVVEAYRAKGGDIREHMRAAIVAGVDGSVPKSALAPIREKAQAALDVLDKAVSPMAKGIGPIDPLTGKPLPERPFVPRLKERGKAK